MFVDIDPDTIKIRRWHPKFKLDSCAAIKIAPIPSKPGAEDGPTSATKLLEMMKERFPSEAEEKLKLRKKELEKAELKKIQEEEKHKSDSTGEPEKSKPKIPAHILAKIRAKQAAKVRKKFNKICFPGAKKLKNLESRFFGDTNSLN